MPRLPIATGYRSWARRPIGVISPRSGLASGWKPTSRLNTARRGNTVCNRSSGDRHVGDGARTLTVREGELRTQGDESTGEGAAHPGEDAGPRDHMPPDRGRKQAIADEDHEGQRHEDAGEL